MDNATPRIAIMMATYNGAAYLARQLDSLLAQTYLHYTIDIADDGSTDGTVEILQSYQNRCPETIHFSVNPERLGVVKNFENLLQRLDAPYVMFCDQDDLWEPDKVARQLEAMQELEAAASDVPCLVHGDLAMMDAEERPLAASYFAFRGYCLRDTKDLGHILGPSGVMGNTVMLNAALRCKALPFPEGLEVHDYWIGIVAELFGKRRTLQQPLVRYRIHATNVSSSVHTLQSRAGWQRWLRGAIRLPYLDSSRNVVMAHLLSLPLDAKDRQVIMAFADYLAFRGSRWQMFWNLVQYDLVKRGVGFRLKLFFKMMLTRRYAHG